MDALFDVLICSSNLNSHWRSGLVKHFADDIVQFIQLALYNWYSSFDEANLELGRARSGAADVLSNSARAFNVVLKYLNRVLE